MRAASLRPSAEYGFPSTANSFAASGRCANIDILAAGLLILDGLARQSFDRLARSQSGPRRLAWPRTSPFHGGNTGSNPVGDAKSNQQLRRTCRFPAVHWRYTGILP